MNDEINSEMIRAIGNPGLDIGKEYLELGIDELINSESVAGLPVVGSIVAIGKTAVAIRDYRYLKNILEFIKGTENVKPEIREKWLLKLGDNKEQIRVGEAIFTLIDKLNDRRKSEVAGKLFSRHIEGKYDYRQYEHICEKLERLFIADLLLLEHDLPQHPDDQERYQAYGLYYWKYSEGIDASKFAFTTERELMPTDDLMEIVWALRN